MDKNDPRREPSQAELDELNEHWREPGDPDGVIEAEERQTWQERHPESSAVPVTVPQRKRRWPYVLLAVLVLAAACAGAYWLGGRKAAAPAPQPSTTSSTGQLATQKSSTSVPTKHYDSTTYGLGFDYPETWTVNDTPTKLTVTSPVMTLKTANGSQTNGHVVVTIRNKQTSLPEFSDGPATAVLASQKLTYKQPSTVQRAQTYLSFLSYAGSNGLDALYITGDNGYQTEQAVPMADVVQGNPLISVTFVSCVTADCTGNTTPLSLNPTDWSDSALATPVTNLLESIVLS